MRFWLGKGLQAAGILVLLAALCAGLGVWPGGEARLPRQIALMVVGAGILYAGVRLERHSS
jgi:hypothetical protein